MIDDSNPEDLNNLKKLERIDIEKEMQTKNGCDSIWATISLFECIWIRTY